MAEKIINVLLLISNSDCFQFFPIETQATGQLKSEMWGDAALIVGLF